MLGPLYHWCQHQPEKLAHLTKRESLPTKCGEDRVYPQLQARRPIHKILSPASVPPPPERFGTPPETWAVAVTTAPRRQETLEGCLRSIRSAGWDGKTHVFAEPGVAPIEGHHWHGANEKNGPWRNFARMIHFLADHTNADAYLICQDDAHFFRGPVREYLEKYVLWITDRPHLTSLYTSSLYLKDRRGKIRDAGWHYLGRGGRFGWWGAVAFVLSRASLEDFAASDVFTGWMQRRQSWLTRDPATIAQVDTALGFWAPPRGGLWSCLPSLVQHVGHTSTIYKSNRASGRRAADWMLGYPPPFDLPPLLERAKSVGVAVAKWASGGFQVATKRLRKQRMAICGTCDWYANGKCQKCGCVIELKAMFPEERCPLDPPRWGPASGLGAPATGCGGCGGK